MEASLSSIVRFCDTYVNREAITDYPAAHNGLQFENSGKLGRIGAAVDASLESIRAAAKEEVDLLLVHHGLFWAPPAPVTGSRFQKYRLLLEQDIAVYSSHLPLDAHPEIGNNASIAARLGRKVSSWDYPYEGHLHPIAAVVDWEASRTELEEKLRALFPQTLGLSFGPESLDRLVISSGGGGGAIPSLRKKGYHTLITGEGQQHHYALAQEEGLNVYFCGHYATEIFGVQNLAQRAAEEFGLSYTFLPTSCPL
ncbi:MAG: Nif3-like dinuclear metal center hexameric protein [Puniceicoccales bacterium]|jgi:dinuclear metal center YbgI/SA1388 family protein|nr:Nif3-like dinuclear metal center hexameric protein [Puniceicoccales bacterium]